MKLNVLMFYGYVFLLVLFMETIAIENSSNIKQSYHVNYLTMTFQTHSKNQKRYVDFGNKFVAVRGKKNKGIDSFAGYYQSLQSSKQNSIYLAKIFSPLLINSCEKRAPNGFTGMRGKRISYADALITNLHGNRKANIYKMDAE